jgi:cytochrome c oxidase subunit 3
VATSHHPALAHHFDDLGQQKDSLYLGMWIFLATEVMVFGGLFTAYTVYYFLYPVAFMEASGHLRWDLAALNTVVLISSSLTMALAVYGAASGSRKMLTGCLALTLLLGLVFLGFKSYEYAIDYRDGLIPTRELFDTHHWKNAGAVGVSHETYTGQVRLFFVLYFCMTGLHAIHMILGMAVLVVMIPLAWRGRYTPEYHPQVEMMGLYWHFVDVIWIFLFPLLYLIGTH